MKICLLLGKKAMTNLDSILKEQRYYFADKRLYSQNYGFSSSHVQMWKLDPEEGWTSKNWCFWIVVLEKNLESSLDCKEIKPVRPKGNQPWIFIGRADAEAPILWPPDVKSQLTGKDPDARKDWRQEGKSRQRITDSRGITLSRLGDSEGQRSLACCSAWCHRELAMT